jgi:hypothetical protein
MFLGQIFPKSPRPGCQVKLGIAVVHYDHMPHAPPGSAAAYLEGIQCYDIHAGLVKLTGTGGSHDTRTDHDRIVSGCHSIPQQNSSVGSK